jgi:hypothetical protein
MVRSEGQASGFTVSVIPHLMRDPCLRRLTLTAGKSTLEVCESVPPAVARQRFRHGSRIKCGMTVYVGGEGIHSRRFTRARSSNFETLATQSTHP